MRHPIYEQSLLDFLTAIGEDYEAAVKAMHDLGVSAGEAMASMEAFAETARNIDWSDVQAYEAAQV